MIASSPPTLPVEHLGKRQDLIPLILREERERQRVGKRHRLAKSNWRRYLRAHVCVRFARAAHLDDHSLFWPVCHDGPVVGRVFMTLPSVGQLEAHWRQAKRHLDRGDTRAATIELNAITTIDSRQPMAWLTLARLAYDERRCRAAVEYARNAAAAVRESGDWRWLPDAALLLQGLGESLLAVQLLQATDQDHPEMTAAAGRIAQCFGQADFHEDALRVLDAALTRGKPTPTLSFMRATTLRHLGRKADATVEFQRCLRIAPSYAAAMLMLAQHDPSADPQGQIARIRHALQQTPRQNPLNTALLNYALFIHLHAAGDTGNAWEALMHGAATKRRSLAWQPEREEERVAAIRSVCQGSFLEPVSPTAAEHVPIFIVGQPRTGTTVLERILGNHSQVASAGELNDFHLELCWQADMLVEHVDPVLLRACADVDFAAIGRGYRQRTAWRAEGRRFLIDKMPINFWYVGLIHKSMPDARIVCLVRDPLDTCFSNLKELFAGNAYPYSYDPLEAAAHHLRFRQLLQYWDEVLPGVVLTVRYEDMVRDPQPVARRVMEHCGLPFEPGCVDLLRNQTPSATASSSQVREQLHSRAIGAWRGYAEPLEQTRAWLAARLPPDAFVAR